MDKAAQAATMVAVAVRSSVMIQIPVLVPTRPTARAMVTPNRAARQAPQGALPVDGNSVHYRAEMAQHFHGRDPLSPCGRGRAHRVAMGR